MWMPRFLILLPDEEVNGIPQSITTIDGLGIPNICFNRFYHTLESFKVAEYQLLGYINPLKLEVTNNVV